MEHLSEAVLMGSRFFLCVVSFLGNPIRMARAAEVVRITSVRNPLKVKIKVRAGGACEAPVPNNAYITAVALVPPMLMDHK
mmetsp:Transcript_29610/g.47630  ORF Transcript_29610/g.47630 Transcript_29610/m.47630 type:complete len:81 (+) Transcript_29610:903-1145(+)